MSDPNHPSKSYDQIHAEILEKIESVSDEPAKAIPMVLVGWVGAVLSIAGGFGLLCAWACHR